MMQEVEVLKTIQELICSFFSEEQFTLSSQIFVLTTEPLYSMVIKNERMNEIFSWMLWDGDVLLLGKYHTCVYFCD